MAGSQGIISTVVSGAQVIPAGRIRENWDDVIHKLNMDQNPLLMLLSKLKKEGKDSMTFNWFNKERKPDWIASSAIGGAWGSGSAATGTFTVAAADVWLFAPADIVMMPSVGNTMLYVTAADQSTGVVTAKTVSGNSINLSALGSALPNIFLVANAFEKGTGMGTIKSAQPVANYNYLQIFQTPIGINTTDQKIAYRGPNEYDEQKAEAGVDHAFKIEKAFFCGERKLVASGYETGRDEQYFTGGLLNTIQTHVLDQNGALTSDDFSEFIAETIRYADNPVVICGDLIYGALAKWQSFFMKAEQRSKEYGLFVDTLMTNKGRRVPLIAHPELLQEDFAGMAFVLDLSDLTYCYLNGMDTHLEIDIQDNASKTKVDEFRTWAGLKVGSEKKHGVLTGVTSITPNS